MKKKIQKIMKVIEMKNKFIKNPNHPRKKKASAEVSEPAIKGTTVRKMIPIKISSLATGQHPWDL
jgi:hypothetical protein